MVMTGRHCRKATAGVKIAVAGLSVLAVLAAAPAADAHRNSCHTKKTCPSDHHTYRWSAKRLWCTSYRDERVAADKIRVVYGGRVYWCHK